jgi:hypothetical protein
MSYPSRHHLRGGVLLPSGFGGSAHPHLIATLDGIKRVIPWSPGSVAPATAGFGGSWNHTQLFRETSMSD